MPSDPMKFFVAPQAAAVLKHAILEQYVPVFASMTGSRSAGGRVVFIDGYAGPGRYEDDTPGSPALALQIAHSASAYRNLRCLFVEKDPKLFSRLDELVTAAKAKGVDADCYRGSAEDHLPQLVEDAADSPLFVFLDPFGVGVDFDLLTGVVLGRSKSGHPKTELLLNFTSPGLDRIGGLITSTKARGREAALARMSRTMGGDWWQKLYLETSSDERVGVIAAEYRRRLGAAASPGWGGWSVPVMDTLDGRPEYLLIHFTQHPAGHWKFLQALSLATKPWRAAVRRLKPTWQEQQAALGQFTFEGFDEPKAFVEDEEAWVDEIEVSVRALLEVGSPTMVRSDLKGVFGRSLGLSRELHLRRALKRLEKEGLLRDKVKGDLDIYTIARATLTS